jgi:curved DNA-binding protein CbpA
MLKELNAAYNVLRDPKARSAYDLTLRGTTSQGSRPERRSTQHKAASTAHGSPPADLGPLCSGYSRYQSLPQAIRDRVTARVNRQLSQQLMVPLRGVAWN